MRISNTKSSFGFLSKTFHWSIALLVLAQFGYIAALKWFVPKGSTTAGLLMRDLHKPFGVVLLGLISLALLWKLVSKRPQFSSTMPAIEKIAAFFTHWLLYLTSLAMAVSGLVMSIAGGYPVNLFRSYQIPFFIEKNKMLAGNAHEIHEMGAWILLALIVIHLLAVIKHQWIDKDNTLKRMLPFH